MTSLVGTVLLLMPGYFGLVILEFLTRARGRDLLARNAISIACVLCAFGELAALEAVIHWYSSGAPSVLHALDTRILGNPSPEKALLDWKVLVSLLVLTTMCVATGSLGGWILKSSPVAWILKKILRRSINQSVLISVLD